jgi:serine/threonine protein kinase
MAADLDIARESVATADTSPVCSGASMDHPAADRPAADNVPSATDLDGFKRSLFAAFDRQTTKVQQTPRRFSSKARFTRRRRIGGGGLGDVYEAVDRKLGRVVAVKISKSVSSWTRSEDDRFFREYQLTARLQHPGIPAVYSAGRLSNGRRFYSMRLVAGQTLAALIRGHQQSTGHLDETARRATLLKILAHFKDVCDTVQAAHQAGYLHLDLKPDNVMVEPSGATFVVDWGLAQPFTLGTAEARTESSGLQHSEAGRTQVVAGTPEFMPPEQMEGGFAEFDSRTDVFALAGILHVILTGSPPRVRPNEASRTRFWSVLRKARSLDTRDGVGPVVGQGIPRELASVCERGLAARPTDRYATALELREDIERWERGENVLAHQHKYRSFERLSRWVAQRATVIVPATLMGLILIVSVAFVALYRANADREKVARQAATEVALGSVQQIVQAVQNEEFLRRPELSALRLELLQNAWKQYDHWAVNAEMNRGLMVQVVQQLHRIADAYDETVSEQELLKINANTRVAESAIERATEVCRRLVSRQDRQTEDQVLLATSYRLGAALDAKRGDADAALAKAALTEQTLSAITGNAPDVVLESVRTQRLIASVHYHRAMDAPTIALRREFLLMAADRIERTLLVLDRIVSTDQSAVRERALTESQAAIVNHKLGRLDAAVTHYERALTLLNDGSLPTPLDGRFDPEWVRRNRLHAQILNNYGLTLRGMQKSQAALQSHKQAHALRNQIVEMYPWLLSVRSELAQSCGNIADTLIDFGDLESEITARREATRLLQRMFDDYPSLPGIKEFWGLHRIRTVVALHRLGEDDEAAQEFVETLANCAEPELAEPTNGGHLLDVALGHLLASHRDEEDKHRQAAIRLILRCRDLDSPQQDGVRRRLLAESIFDLLQGEEAIKSLLEPLSPESGF